LGQIREEAGDRAFAWPSWEVLVRRVRAVVARRGAGLQVHDLQDVEQGVLVRIHRYRRSRAGARSGVPIDALVHIHVAWELKTHFRRSLRPGPTSEAGSGVRLDDLVDAVAPDPSESAAACERLDAFRECLARLTPVQRRRYLASLGAREGRISLSELARRLKITLSSLKETLKIARSRIRVCMRRSGFLGRISPPDGTRGASKRGED